MASRESSRANSRTSRGSSISTKQARNVAKIISELGLGRQYPELMKASRNYEKDIQKAKGGVSRNEEEIRALPDDIERASMLGQPQKEEALEHSLETTRPKERKMYANWAKRLTKKLEQEALAAQTSLAIGELVPKDRDITESDMQQIRGRVQR